MSVRKRKGRPGWYFKHRDPKTKKEYFRYGGPTRRAAQVAERKLIQELEKSSGKFPGDDDLNNFIETDYWPSQKNHLTPKGAERGRGILNKHLGPDFSGPMSKITRAKLIAYIDKRLNHDHASRESVRKELTVFKHALRIAVKIQLLARNPFEDLEQKDWPPKGEERTRHLVGDEWPRLIAEVPRIMRPAAAVL